MSRRRALAVVVATPGVVAALFLFAAFLRLFGMVHGEPWRWAPVVTIWLHLLALAVLVALIVGCWKLAERLWDGPR